MTKYLNDTRRFYLQWFADESEGDPQQPDQEDQKPADSGADAGKDAGKSSAEDEKKYSDSELDRIISKKKAAWKAEAEKQIEAARTEAEKLAKMNDEEKHRYEAEKKDSQISELGILLWLKKPRKYVISGAFSCSNLSLGQQKGSRNSEIADIMIVDIGYRPEDFCHRHV